LTQGGIFECRNHHSGLEKGNIPADQGDRGIGRMDLRQTSAALPTPNSETTTGKKRRHLSPKGRKGLSEMMKKRWAEA